MLGLELDNALAAISGLETLPSDGSNAQQRLAVYEHNKYIYACHWIAFYRLGIGNLNRYPLNTYEARIFRPFARVLIARLDILIKLHEFAPRLYPNEPITHWLELELEFKQSAINFNIQDLAISPDKPKPNKKDWLRDMRFVCNQLENRQNPFTVGNVPLYFNLIETCCNYAERGKHRYEFIQDYWMPYIEKLREYFSHCETEGQGFLYISGQKLMQSTNKGKAIHPPVKKTKDKFLAKYYCL